MIQPFRDKKQIARRKLITEIVIFVCVFLFLSSGVLLSSSGKLLNLFGRPVWVVKNATVGKVENVLNFFRTKSSLLAENNKLKVDNSYLDFKMIDYKILKDENDQLKDLMGRLPNKHNFILANILTKPDLSPYDTIVVDAGISLGIKEESFVYANGNIPIGKVDKVYLKTSLIMLYSNPGQVTNGMIDGSENSVVLIGRGGGNFEIKVPQESVIEKGTMVILPNVNSVGSEVVAIVEEVISTKIDPYKKVLLRSPVNVQAIKWVEIEK